MSRYVRRRGDGEEQQATTLELFYDLVFVFAITQVSHLLLDHLTLGGRRRRRRSCCSSSGGRGTTRRGSPTSSTRTSIVVRLLLIALMLREPADGGRDPARRSATARCSSPASYVAIQVGRHAFLDLRRRAAGDDRARARGRDPDLVRRRRACSGSPARSPTAPARTAALAVALAIDYGGAARARTGCPGCRGSRPTVVGRRDVATSPSASSCSSSSRSASRSSSPARRPRELDLDAARLAAFALAFLGTAAMWWLYFDYVARRSPQRRLELADEPHALARDGYTYLHVVMVAGVIVAAVGDELVIAHPTEVLHGAELAAVVAGPGDLPARARAVPAADGGIAEPEAPRRRRSAASPSRPLGPFVSALVAARARRRRARRA